MRILDENGRELLEPDYDLGFTEEETIVTAHHEAEEGVEEVWHYEVIRKYPNGGQDVVKVVDVPGSPAREAWDELETVLRWHPYSAEELAARREEAERAAALARENALLRAQVSALTENLSFLEDCIVEMAEILYN